jgi:hypothetical protein
MKRKVTAFPSAAVCPMVPAAPPPSRAQVGQQEKLAAAKVDLEGFSALRHEFTARLRAEANGQEVLQSSLISVTVDEVSGLLELIVRAGTVEGYGRVPWTLIVGGPSHDEQMPCCVRFKANYLMALPDVDDTGKIHSALLFPMGNNTTLASLVGKLSDLLEGSLHNNSEAFCQQQQLCLRKLNLIETFRTKYLTPPLLETAHCSKIATFLVPALRNCDPAGMRALVEETAPGIFVFNCFTTDGCERLLRLVDEFERSPLPRRRPNSMNNEGLILNDVGCGELMSDLLEEVIVPLSRACFGEEVNINSLGGGLDHHHSFVVCYTSKEIGPGDEGLDMHVDASEITLNVNLGRGDDVEYAGLVFCGTAGSAQVRRHQHSLVQCRGQAVLHLGRQRHGAGKIQKGQRLNLIVWARNSSFRAAAAAGLVFPDGYPKAHENPELIDKVCLSAANDPDYEFMKKRG